MARCAETIGARTIAEAIESEEQLRVCRDETDLPAFRKARERAGGASAAHDDQTIAQACGVLAHLFRQADAEGFIRLNALRLRIRAMLRA